MVNPIQYNCKTYERIRTIFEEIITSKEIKFNNLEKKVYKFICLIGCFGKLLLEKIKSIGKE